MKHLGNNKGSGLYFISYTLRKKCLTDVDVDSPLHMEDRNRKSGNLLLLKRALNVKLPIFCPLLYRTSLMIYLLECKLNGIIFVCSHTKYP